MSTIAAGLLTSFGAWKTFQWFMPKRDIHLLDNLTPEEWIKKSDIIMLLFTLECYTRNNAKRFPYVKKLEEQREKVDKLMGKLQTVLGWKNDGWRYYYRSWMYTGENKIFLQLKEEHTILLNRVALLKQLES